MLYTLYSSLSHTSANRNPSRGNHHRRPPSSPNRMESAITWRRQRRLQCEIALVRTKHIFKLLISEWNGERRTAKQPQFNRIEKRDPNRGLDFDTVREDWGSFLLLPNGFVPSEDLSSLQKAFFLDVYDVYM